MTRRRSRQALLQQGLNKRATSEADINHRIYVRPLGDTGLHIVKSRPDGAEYQVAGPARTFTPGQFVPTGRHTNTQGETILIEPPPGKRGQAAPPTTTTSPPLPQEDVYVHYTTGTTAGYHSEIFHAFGKIAGTEDPYPAPSNAFLYMVDGIAENGSPDGTAFSLFSFEPFDSFNYKVVVVNRESYVGNADPGADPPIPPACRIAFNDENGVFLGAQWHYFWVA